MTRDTLALWAYTAPGAPGPLVAAEYGARVEALEFTTVAPGGFGDLACILTLRTGPSSDGFSVLRRSLRHGSPTALPEPFNILGSVMVAMEARSTVRTGMPADRQALGDEHATARTPLAGERRIHRNH
jgi:hypothetical protein